MNPTFAPRLRPLLSVVSRGSRRRRPLSTKAPDGPAPSGQAHPRAGFYDALLEYKLPPQDHTGKRSHIPPPQPEAEPPTPAKPSSEPAMKRKRKTAGTDADEEPHPDSPAGRARIVFGSSLAGPTRRADIRSQSTLIEGVLVPPKPEEPDHCCMSGCVNCVWDTFREDMEEWVAMSTKAKKRQLAKERGADGKQPEAAGAGVDEGTQASQAALKREWKEDLYTNIPVGIREFMKLEKQLKEMHEETGTTGG